MEESLTQRTILFISHALPEDNEFVLWLAAKLRNEGYDVWCEIEQVHGGEHFWKEIEKVLRTQAVKMILVASHVSLKKDGVRAEWDFARELAREQQLKDFIIPLNFDGVSSNAIMGLTNLAMIPFYTSWALGIKALLRKLEKDNVFKNGQNHPLSAAQWYFNRFATSNTVNDRAETFYSNWLALPQLPCTLFVHEYTNEVQARQIIEYIRKERLFPIVRHDRFVITFEEKLPALQLAEVYTSLFNIDPLEVINTICLSVEEIQNRFYKSKVFPTTQDASNFLVQLLQQAFHDFLLQKSLLTYELANNKLCYYYARTAGSDIKVKYNYQGKSRSKQLTGIYYEKDFWHYGISFVVRLHPIPAISVKAHIVFSNDGKAIWQDKKTIHSARRKKGKRMFNAEWRDLLLAFLSSLSDDQAIFGILFASQEYLWVSATPIIFTSDKGYEDPQDKGRLEPMNSSEEDIEYDDERDKFDPEAALAGLESMGQEILVTDKEGENHEEVV